MNVWNNARERCFDRVFGNGYNFIYDLIKNYYDNDIEFEIRIADCFDHCGSDYWNAYNSYLEPTTDLSYDIILTYENPNLIINKTKFREYKYGNVIQAKSVISKFSNYKKPKKGEQPSLNNEIIPLVAKICRERYIPTIRALKPTSYAKTYRQSFKIECSIVSSRTKTYLKNWSVDKTVRIITDNLNDERFNKSEVRDVHNPIFYDMLDLEFEYIGESNDLESSILALFEFIYLAHPNKNIFYQSVSFEYQIYNIMCQDKLKQFMVNPTVAQHNDAVKKYYIPNNSKPVTIIYDDDTNYITIGDKIDFSTFTDFGIYKFNIIKAFVSDNIYAIDIYIHENENITTEKYENRLKILKKFNTNVWQLPSEEINYDYDCIYIMNDITKTSIMPKVVEMSLKVKKHTDGISYILYTKDDVMLSSPLMKNKLYQPEERNEFEKAIKNEKIFINGETLCFQCIENEFDIDLVPIRKSNDIVTLQEASLLILEAFAQSKCIAIENEKTFTSTDLLLQAIIEKYNKNRMRNIYVLEDKYNVEDKLMRLVSNFIKYDNLVFKSSSKNIINNLVSFYTDSFITPIYREKTRMIVGSEKHISILNENGNISDLPGLFKRDMDFTITSFMKFNTLTSFIKCFENIQANTCIDGIILLNYININVNLYDFINDVSRVLTEAEITKIEETGSIARYNHTSISIDIDDVKEIKKFLRIILSKRPRNYLTIIRTNKKINSKDLEFVGYDIKNVYKFGEISTPSSVLRNYLLKNIQSNIDDIKDDIILFMMKVICSYFSYGMNVFYPIEINEVCEKIIYNRKICNLFGDIDEYKKYVSIQIKINV